MACFLVFVLLLVVFMENGPNEEAKERHKWCDEYHPNLTCWMNGEQIYRMEKQKLMFAKFKQR